MTLIPADCVVAEAGVGVSGLAIVSARLVGSSALYRLCVDLSRRRVLS